MRALLLVVLLLGACRAGTIDGRRVATLPDSVDEWWVDISRDGSRAAWADRQGREVELVVGDRTFGPYT